MNTSKQINIMVILIFLTLIALGAYTLFDPQRQENAQAQQTDVLAERGAALFAQYCRPCHGDVGQGRIGPALNRPELHDPLKLEQNQLFVYNTINCGRVGTLMPTWGLANGGPLNDEQIHDLVTLITVDPKGPNGQDAWQRYVKPDSAAANKIATAPAVADLLKNPVTGSKESVCGQKIAGTPAAAPAAAAPANGAQAGTPTTTLSETTTDDKFSATSFTVPAGQQVTITVNNKGQALHNWHVLGVKSTDGKDIKTDLLASGASAKLTFTIAQAGTYKFQCDVHPTEMIGTLIVLGAAGTQSGGGAGVGVATPVPNSGPQTNPSTGVGIGTPQPAGATGATPPASPSGSLIAASPAAVSATPTR